MIIMLPIKKSLVALYRSIKRFPVTLSLTFSMAIVLIVTSEIRINQGYNNPVIEILDRIAMTIALGIPLTLSIKLLFEKYRRGNTLAKALAYIIASGFLGFYYSFLLKTIDTSSVSRYIGLSFALYLCFLFIPFLTKRKFIELYIIKVFNRFFITIIYSGVLFLGIAAILFTIDKLLDITVKGILYYYIWLLIVGIFSPAFFLAGIPEYNENLEEYSYPKFFRILLLYIVMPLVTIYLGILYIYFAKIIITLKWPEGLVSHLVLWYSAFCVGLIFLISPIKKNEWVNKFTFWFPKLIIPILVIMFISMGIRINAYGITENRYYVVILGLWVLAMMLLINLKKERRNSAILISLAIVSVLSVFGPSSSFTVSKLSQNNRLKTILIRNEMLKDNAVIIGKNTISEGDKSEISEILKYFKRNHSLRDVKYLREDFTINDMEKVFGFKYQESDIYRPNEQYISYSTNGEGEAVDISGYDYLIDLRMVKVNSEKVDLKVEYNYDDGVVNIFRGDEMVYTLELLQLLEGLKEKYPNSGTVNPQDMIYVDENQNIKVKFIFNYIDGRETEEGIKANGADFYVLIKKK